MGGLVYFFVSICGDPAESPPSHSLLSGAGGTRLTGPVWCDAAEGVAGALAGAQADPHGPGRDRSASLRVPGPRWAGSGFSLGKTSGGACPLKTCADQMDREQGIKRRHRGSNGQDRGPRVPPVLVALSEEEMGCGL